jgi:hypothetical protein
VARGSKALGRSLKPFTRHAFPRPVVVGTAIVAAVAAVVVIAGPSWDAGPASGPGPPQPSSAPASPEGASVPDVGGLTAMEAGRMLARAGLSIADAEPASGPPGIVVGTDPPVGRIVEAGTSVTLYVGAPPDRLTPES